MTETTTRDTDLRNALMTRRGQLQDAVQERIQEGRTSQRTAQACDMVDVSDAILQEDIDLALLQMKAETLKRIDEALGRLDAGQYGRCFECDGSIPVARIRALPFAVRCVDCEQSREDHGSLRRAAARRQMAPFANTGRV